MSLLSKTCRGEDFTQEELAANNLSRKDAIPLISGPLKKTDRVQHQITETPRPKAKQAAMSGLTDPVGAKWTYFSFSPTSLKDLKDLATSSMASQASVHFEATSKAPYIFTDDALSASIWRSVTSSRRPRFKANSNTNFARAIDVRPYFDLPVGYPGLMQNETYSRSVASKLVGGSSSSLNWCYGRTAPLSFLP